MADLPFKHLTADDIRRYLTVDPDVDEDIMVQRDLSKPAQLELSAVSHLGASGGPSDSYAALLDLLTLGLLVRRWGPVTVRCGLKKMGLADEILGQASASD